MWHGLFFLFAVCSSCHYIWFVMFGSDCQCALSDDSTALLISPIQVTVLAEKRITSPTDSLTVLVPVAVNDFLLVLGVQERCVLVIEMIPLSGVLSSNHYKIHTI